jgi:hypothetical protein
MEDNGTLEIPMYAHKVEIKKLNTNGSPVTIRFQLGNDSHTVEYLVLQNITKISGITIVVESTIQNLWVCIYRQNNDVNMSLEIIKWSYPIDPVIVKVGPNPLPILLIIYLIYRFYKFNRKCWLIKEVDSEAQVRWSANELPLIILLIIVSGVLVSPFLYSLMRGDFVFVNKETIAISQSFAFSLNNSVPSKIVNVSGLFTEETSNYWIRFRSLEIKEGPAMLSISLKDSTIFSCVVALTDPGHWWVDIPLDLAVSPLISLERLAENVEIAFELWTITYSLYTKVDPLPSLLALIGGVCMFTYVILKVRRLQHLLRKRDEHPVVWTE